MGASLPMLPDQELSDLLRKDMRVTSSITNLSRTMNPALVKTSTSTHVAFRVVAWLREDTRMSPR